MGAWRVEQHYGIGAANVRLSAEPYAHPSRRWSVREGTRRLRDDLHREGRSLRRSLGVLPALALVLTVLVSFVLTVVRDRVDDSPVEIVMWSPAPEPPAMPLEPDPPPPPPARTEPAPPPPEPVVARAKPPAPEPVVARPPPPPPKQPAARPAPPEPPPVRIDAIARTPAEPPPSRVRAARPELPDPARTAPPRPDVAPLAAAPAPSAPAPSTRRFAGVRPPPGERAARRPSVEPVMAAVPAAPAPATARPIRTDRARPDAPSGAPSARPDLAPAAPAVPVARASAPRITRSGVAAPAAADRSRPDVRVAGLAAPAARPAPRAPAPTRVPTRGEKPAPAPGSVRSAPDQGLAGVPLGALAACLSDREEDTLKQRVVATVTTQKECVSAAGTYRFVETKNLNSFLMWVDPARGRAQGDRCDELGLALACLQSGRSR